MSGRSCSSFKAMNFEFLGRDGGNYQDHPSPTLSTSSSSTIHTTLNDGVVPASQAFRAVSRNFLPKLRVIITASAVVKQISILFERSTGARRKTQGPPQHHRNLYKESKCFITIVQGSISPNAHQQHTGVFSKKKFQESSHRKRKRYIVCNDSHIQYCLVVKLHVAQSSVVIF